MSVHFWTVYHHHPSVHPAQLVLIHTINLVKCVLTCMDQSRYHPDHARVTRV